MPTLSEDDLTPVQIAEALISTDDDPLAALIRQELGQRPTYTIESAEGVTTFPSDDYNDVAEWLGAGKLAPRSTP